MALTALAGDVHITVSILFSSTTSKALRVVVVVFVLVVATSASSVVVLDTRAAAQRSLRAVVAFRCPRAVVALVEADVVVEHVINIIVARVVVLLRSFARASSCVTPTVRARADVDAEGLGYCKFYHWSI